MVDHILIKKDIGDKMNLHFGMLREKLDKYIPYTAAPREKIVSKRASTGLENELYDSRFQTKWRFEATKANKGMFKIAFQQLFDNFNVNFRITW